MLNDIATDKREAGIEVGALLTSIFVIATCGLLYELIIGSLSSYLLGDSVLQFSLTIGFFLTAMGIGSFLSRVVRDDLLKVFLVVEIAIGLIGGASAAWLFGVYALLRRSYLVILLATIVVLGTMIGLEIPLLTRIAKRYGNLRDTLANVLAGDLERELATVPEAWHDVPFEFPAESVIARPGVSNRLSRNCSPRVDPSWGP